MRSRLSILTVVAVLPLILFGCSHELAISDWVARADGVCQASQAAADANPSPPSPLPGDKLRQSAQRSHDEVDALRKLDPPSEKKSSVAEYLLTLEHRSDELTNYANELDKTPAQGAAPNRSHLEDLTTEAFTKGVALGLDHCNGGVDFTLETTTTGVSSVTTTPVPTAVGGQPANEDNTQDQPG